MAVRLEDMLEPKERVVYRLRRRWLPPGLLSVFGFMTLVVLIGFWVAGEPEGGLYAGAGCMLFFVVMAYGVSKTTKVVITDRRILAQSPVGQPVFEELRFAEIEAVETIYGMPGPSVYALGSDGRTIGFNEPSDLKGLAAALSDAGLQVPAPPRRWIRIVSMLSEWLSMAFILANGLAVAGLLSLWLDREINGATLLAFAAFAVLLPYLILVSFLLAELVTLAVLRLTGTAAETCRWVERHRGEQSWRDRGAASLSLRFAGYLWGPAWNAENRGGEHNGA